MERASIILASVAIATSLSLPAQEWTLVQCVERASAYNLTIKQQIARTSASEVTLSQARSEALPTLSGYAEAGINSAESYTDGTYTATERQTYMTAQVGVTSLLDLWNGHRVRNNVEKQSILLDASKLGAKATTQDVILYVTSSFLDVVYQVENVKNLENQLAVTKAQVERTRILVESGNLARHELSRMLMQQAQESAGLAGARNKLSLSTLTLGQTLELRGDSLRNFNVTVPALPAIEAVAVEHPDSIYASARLVYPELKAQELVLSSYENDVKVARASGMPTVYLKGQLYSNYSGVEYQVDEPSLVDPYGSQFSDNMTAQLLLGVSIPIFNKHSTRWAVAQSKIARVSAQLDLDLKQKDLYKKAQSSWLDASSAKEQYAARAEAARLAAESFDLAREQYNAGTMDGISFIIEKNNLAQAESDVLLAKYHFIFKLKQIDLLQGRAISL